MKEPYPDSLRLFHEKLFDLQIKPTLRKIGFAGNIEWSITKRYHYQVHVAVDQNYITFPSCYMRDLIKNNRFSFIEIAKHTDNPDFEGRLCLSFTIKRNEYTDPDMVPVPVEGEQLLLF